MTAFPAEPAPADTVLDVRALGVSFRTPRGLVPAIRDVSFSLRAGRTLALVGESGSGKSTTGLALLGLHGEKTAMAEGQILLSDRNGAVSDVNRLPPRHLRAIRGSEIAMIFQEPMSSLNPLQSIGTQIAEAIFLHQPAGRAQMLAQATDLLATLGVPDPEGTVRRYPHELSGGMRQRVMIAMALACNPRILIADEPTTALDVTIQAQILDLLTRLQKRTGMSMLFVTHNLGVVREIADDVAVMYGGRIVESGTVEQVFDTPRMPYTRALLRSLPQMRRPGEPRRRLEAIRGSIPGPLNHPPGCAFHPRCDFMQSGICDSQQPELLPVTEETGERHLAACHFRMTPGQED